MEHLAIHLQTAPRGAAGRQSCLAFTAAEFICSAIGMMTFHYNEVAVSIYIRHMQSGALDAICAYKRHMRHAPQQTEGHPASIYLQVQFSKCGCTLTSRPSLSHRTTPNHEDCLRCKCPIGASVLQQHQTFSLRMSCDQANNQIATDLASARLIETRPESLTLPKWKGKCKNMGACCTIQLSTTKKSGSPGFRTGLQGVHPLLWMTGPQQLQWGRY